MENISKLQENMSKIRRICPKYGEYVQSTEIMFKIWRICTEYGEYVQNMENMYRVRRVCSKYGKYIIFKIRGICLNYEKIVQILTMCSKYREPNKI